MNSVFVIADPRGLKDVEPEATARFPPTPSRCGSHRRSPGREGRPGRPPVPRVSSAPRSAGRSRSTMGIARWAAAEVGGKPSVGEQGVRSSPGSSASSSACTARGRATPPPPPARWHLSRCPVRELASTSVAARDEVDSRSTAVQERERRRIRRAANRDMSAVGGRATGASTPRRPGSRSETARRARTAPHAGRRAPSRPKGRTRPRSRRPPRGRRRRLSARVSAGTRTPASASSSRRNGVEIAKRRPQRHLRREPSRSRR